MLHPYRTLSPQNLAHMKAEGVVVLSPHLDDACFSIGSLLHKVGAGALVNVFSRSLYLARCPAGVSLPLTEPVVSAIRTAEDEQFAAMCGLSRYGLGLAGPELANRRPNDGKGLAQDEAVATPVLIAMLTSLAQDRHRPYLLAPVAVGRHVNHHAVHQVMRHQAADLMPRFRLGFYEDLPYAHDPIERMRGLRRFANEWRNQGFERYVWPCDWRDKRALVSLYATQLRRSPAAWKFRPAALWPWGMHEAVWLRPQDVQAQMGGAGV